MRHNLVVVRAGDASLHPQWVKEGANRNFDLFVSYYGETSNHFTGSSEYYEAVAGLKWPAIAELLVKHRDLLMSYDAYWFPDDDLLTDGATISRMFDLFRQFDLWLAQPALGAGSYASFRITRAVYGMKLRYTNFVEIMCPLFNWEGLRALQHTFGASISGWGLDVLWPFLLRFPKDRIAILDETTVMHTRPLRSGPFYSRCASMGVEPRLEARIVMNHFGLHRAAKKEVYSSISLTAPAA